MLLSFHKVGETNTGRPRLWIESLRLNKAGFEPGTPYRIERGGNRLVLRRENTGQTDATRVLTPIAPRHVSYRRRAGRQRPVIEITGGDLRDTFGDIEALKATTHLGMIELRPTLRAALIRRALAKPGPLRVLEAFAGGGTLGEALSQNPAGGSENDKWSIRAGIEINPDYADIWAARNPNALLVMGDIRLIHPAELPRFDVLLAGIPCTSHSKLGRASHKLKGRPEEGETGDLFAHTLNLVAHHMPLACVFENVPQFGTSLAGSVLRKSLEHIGYHLQETILDPHGQWAEPSDRKRWCLIATLKQGWGGIKPPKRPEGQPQSLGSLGLLDEENESLDREDALRIAGSIEGLRRHQERHAALGHGFGFTTINRLSTKVPTLARSYAKINSGPFVETPHGLRLLRLSEAERIMGANAGTEDFRTGMEVLGQGVQTRMWRQILDQLHDFLRSNEEERGTSPKPNPDPELALLW